MFPTKYCFEKTIKMQGNHSRLTDEMGHTYPIYACARYILWKLETWFIKVILGTKLNR